MAEWKRAWIALDTATVRGSLVQACVTRYERKQEQDAFCMTFYPGFTPTHAELEPLGVSVDRVAHAPDFANWYSFFMGIFRTWGGVWVLHDAPRVFASLEAARKKLPQQIGQEVPIPRRVIELAQVEHAVTRQLARSNNLATLAARWGVRHRSESKILDRCRTIGSIFSHLLDKLPDDDIALKGVLNSGTEAKLSDETDRRLCCAS